MDCLGTDGAIFLDVILGFLVWEVEEHTAADDYEVRTIVQNDSNINGNI